MRNKIDPSEAVTIGTRLRAARKRANHSVVDVGRLTGVHHSQILRCEKGEFKTASPNVQKLCEFLAVSHPKLAPVHVGEQALRDRFDALLKARPGSAVAFARLFDVMEDAQGGRRAASKRKVD